MRIAKILLCPILTVCVVIGSLGLVGCSPDGTGSAPKLKGSKDEIQKATQSGVPGKGAAGAAGGRRRGDL